MLLPSLAEIAVAKEPFVKATVCPLEVLNCNLKSSSSKTALAVLH